MLNTFAKHLKKDWEELGSLDPLYAVLSHAEKKNGHWDEQEFFATGKKEINELMKVLQEIGLPRERLTALDFGCGVGRLTRALSSFFASVTGLDISESMVVEAKKRHADFPTCTFLSQTQPHLRIFFDHSFDLVYSSIVLQHVPNLDTVKAYLAEFVRILKPDGIAVFQIPVRIPWRSRLQPQQRLYHLLRSLGVSSKRLYRWNLLPISMNAMEEGMVRATVERAGGRIVAVEANNFSGPKVESKMFYVTKNSLVRLGHA